MTIDTLIPFIKKFGRTIIIILISIIYAIVFFTFKFSTPKEETEDTKKYEILKLVDIEEYVPPVEPEPSVEQVVNETRASENIEETDNEVRNVYEDDIVYLPQHKISAIPEIPTSAIIANIVYPPMAQKQGIQGVVYLELFIDEQGKIRRVQVLKDPGNGFAEAAVKALNGIKCKPALANGKAVAVRFRYPVRFTIN